MTTARMREQLARRLRRLSPNGLRLVDDFAAYVEMKELDPATAEILSNKSLMTKVAEGEADLKEGRTTPWRKNRRDV